MHRWHLRFSDAQSDTLRAYREKRVFAVPRNKYQLFSRLSLDVANWQGQKNRRHEQRGPALAVEKHYREDLERPR